MGKVDFQASPDGEDGEKTYFKSIHRYDPNGGNTDTKT